MKIYKAFKNSLTKKWSVASIEVYETEKTFRVKDKYSDAGEPFSWSKVFHKVHEGREFSKTEEEAVEQAFTERTKTLKLFEEKIDEAHDDINQLILLRRKLQKGNSDE